MTLSSTDRPRTTKGTAQRRWPVSRTLALVITAGIVAALVFLAVRPQNTMAVPDGARAGDLSMQKCDYTTEAGTVRAECGTLVVPENRGDQASDLIALPVVRIPASAQQPREPVSPSGPSRWRSGRVPSA
jgi:hypothetical protein